MSTIAQLLVKVTSEGISETIAATNKLTDADKLLVAQLRSGDKDSKASAEARTRVAREEAAEIKKVEDEIIASMRARNREDLANAAASAQAARIAASEIRDSAAQESAAMSAVSQRNRDLAAVWIAGERSKTQATSEHVKSVHAEQQSLYDYLESQYKADLAAENAAGSAKLDLEKRVATQSAAYARARAEAKAQLAAQEVSQESLVAQANREAVSAQNQASSAIAASKRGESNSVVSDLQRQIAAEKEALAARLRAAAQNGTVSAQFIAQSKLETNQRVADLQRQIAEQTQASNKSSAIYSSIVGQLTGLAAAYVSVQGAVRLFNDTISTAAGYQTLERQLEFLTGGGVADATKELGYLTDVSNRYGTVLLQSTESYAALASAMKLSGISMQGVHQTYEALSAVAATYALSQDKVNAIMLAFTQIAGKGRVQSEELVRQLGQYIPALQLGAQAMGMSIRDFNKALKEGSVASADFLPKFSALIQAMYGSDLERKTDTITAAQNRLKTQFQESLNAVSTQTGASDAYKNALEGLAVAMKSIGDDKEFLNALSAIGTVVGFLAKGTIGTVAVPLIALKDTLSGVSYVMSQVGYALGGIVYGAANSGEAILRASGEWSDFNATLEANKIIQQQIADEELRWVNILNTATSALDDVQKKLQQVQISQLQGPAKINYWSSVIDDAKNQIEVLQAAQDQLKAQRSALAPQTTSGSTKSRQAASDDIGKLDAAIAEQELALANARLTLANATQSLGNESDALFISLSKAQKTYSSLTGVQKSYADQIRESNQSISSLRETLASLGDYQFGEPPERTQARVNVINGLIDATNRLNAAQSNVSAAQSRIDAMMRGYASEREQIDLTYAENKKKLTTDLQIAGIKEGTAAWDYYFNKLDAGYAADVAAFNAAEKSKTDALIEQLAKRDMQQSRRYSKSENSFDKKSQGTVVGGVQAAGLDIFSTSQSQASVDDEYSKQFDALERWHQVNLNSEEEYQKQKIEIEKRYADASDRTRETRQQTAVTTEQQMMNDLYTLAKTGNRSMIAVYKAAAISETMISTYSSAQKAFDSLAGIPYVGPTLGAAAAALAIAAGMVRVQTISQQSFATGGFTGSGGKYDKAGDVHRGEDVWTQEDVRAAGGPAAAEQIRHMYGAGGSRRLNWMGTSYAEGGYAAPTPTVNASSNVSVPIQINNTSDSTVTAKTQTINGQTIVQIAVAQAKAELYNDIASWNGPMANALSAQGVRRG